MTRTYALEQLETALGSVLGVDRQLIEDGTYFVVESEGTLVACGGWSRRKTLFGATDSPVKDRALLDPASDAAKIRAFFVHPAWARRGIGARLLAACERAAAEAGFSRVELGATLSGIEFYRKHGYEEVAPGQAPLSDGGHLEILKMAKPLK